ncbi:MAG: hypothetical protein ACRD0L_05655 [Acidimicrobiales bacterium]
MRGRPFEGLKANWVYEGQHVYAIESAVVDVAERLGAHCLEAGDAAGARWAARRGLLVAAYDERLWRILLEAALAEGGQIALESVWAECCRALEATVEPWDSLQPVRRNFQARPFEQPRCARRCRQPRFPYPAMTPKASL